MNFFLPIATIAAYAVTVLSLTVSFVACSNDKSMAGIEIGNPELADADTTEKDTTVKDTAEKKQPALPLVAAFSIDYSDASSQAFAKKAAQEEPMLLDSFSLVLTQVRSFSSYYTSVSIDPVLGLQLWPYEDSPAEELEISFTEGSSIEDPFKDIDLQEEGYLKEMGVGFRPDETSAIFGRLKIGKKYIPFVYSLSNFQTLMLLFGLLLRPFLLINIQ